MMFANHQLAISFSLAALLALPSVDADASSIRGGVAPGPDQDEGADTDATFEDPFASHLRATAEDGAVSSKLLRELPRRIREFEERRRRERGLQTADASLGDVQAAYVGTIPTKTYVSIPVPHKDALSMPSTMSFAGFPATKGHTVGVHTTFYDARVDFPVDPAVGLLYLVGDLEPASSIDPANPAPAAFAYHPWVGDDVLRLFPQYNIVANGASLACNAQPTLTRLTDSPAHQMYSVINRCGGLVTEFYVHAYNDHPVVEWELVMIFSDYTVPDVGIDIDKLEVTFGEYTVVDDYVPLGMSSGVGTYNGAASNTFTSTLATSFSLGHGQGTPIFKGALLCLDNSAPFDAQIRNPAITGAPEWNYLLARVTGQVLAGRTNWDDSWLAFQAAIPRDLPGDDALLDALFDSQYGMMTSPQDLFAQKKLGLNKNAGSTGMQGDFGSQKGTQATHGDIRFVATWHYHLQESLRPFHYREADGSKTTGDTQSDWVTWSQVTHYHPSQSPNQLGKPAWVGIPSQGWSGKDDQHKSSNALNAAVAALDWPAYRSMLRDEVNVALENVRFKPGQDPGAPRAIGRRMLADTNAYLLTGDNWVWERLVLWHASNALAKSHVGAQPDPAALDYVRVSEVHTGDKPPFLCAATTNCVQGVHPPLPKVIIWQHGLLMKGLVAAWNTHLYRQSLGLAPVSGAGVQDLEAFIVELATTSVRHFFAEVGGSWQTWNYIAWNGGVPVDPSVIAASSSTAGLTHERITVGNTWWDWHFPGYYYLARANHGLALPSDVVARLDSMATETETVALAPGASFTRREWYPFTS